MKTCSATSSGPTLGRTDLAQRRELSVQTFKHRERAVIGTQSQDPAPHVFDHAPPFGRMKQWHVFANQRILTYQAQGVHRHRSQSADQEVGVKLAAGQTLRVHIGLELRMKLLVRGVVFVQINDVLHRELLPQCRRPALNFVGVQLQRVTVLVDGALDQAQNPPRRIGLVANAFQLERVSPQAHAFVIAQMTHHGVGILHAPGGDGLHGRLAGIPIDNEGNLARQGSRLGVDILHDFQGAQARVGTKQKRHRGQLRGHGQDPLQVEFSLQRGVLHARAQGQLKTITQGTQVDGAWCVDVQTLVRAPKSFFLGPRVVHHKGIPVHGHVAAGQGAKVHGAVAYFADSRAKLNFSASSNQGAVSVSLRASTICKY
jgi:hypothetical protein